MSTDAISTQAAARRLGVNPSALSRAVWAGRVSEPARSPVGTFMWTEADLRCAAWVLLHRDLEDVLRQRQEVPR